MSKICIKWIFFSYKNAKNRQKSLSGSWKKKVIFMPENANTNHWGNHESTIKQLIFSGFEQCLAEKISLTDTSPNCTYAIRANYIKTLKNWYVGLKKFNFFLCSDFCSLCFPFRKAIKKSVAFYGTKSRIKHASIRKSKLGRKKSNWLENSEKSCR